MKIVKLEEKDINPGDEVLVSYTTRKGKRKEALGEIYGYGSGTVDGKHVIFNKHNSNVVSVIVDGRGHNGWYGVNKECGEGWSPTGVESKKKDWRWYIVRKI